jgi:hypothetical protein
MKTLTTSSIVCAALLSGCAAYQRSPTSVFLPTPSGAAGTVIGPTDAAPGNNQPTQTNRPATDATGTAPQPWTTIRPPTPNAPAGGSTTQPFRPELDDSTLRGPATGTGSQPSGSQPTQLERRIDPLEGEATSEPLGDLNAPHIPDPNAFVTPENGVLASGSNGSDIHHRTGRTQVAGDVAKPEWRAIGLSAGKRPIEGLQFGTGSQHLFVFSSLVGNEAETVAFVEALVARWSADPQVTGGWNVLVVRSPNPDGLAESTQTNHRGVILNRNYPSANFLARRTTETGPEPASESETQLMLQILRDFRPERVVHVRSGQGAKPLILASAPAAETLRDRLDRALIDGGMYEAYKVGSVEEYVAAAGTSEMLTFCLPKSLTNSATSLAAIDRALAGGVAVPTTQESLPATPVTHTGTTPTTDDSSTSAASDRLRAAGDLFAPYTAEGAVAASPETAAPRRMDGKRGNVQFLPPPPTGAGTGSDPRYFELAPPPG